MLGSTVNDTACRERYVDVRTNAPETFIRYQRMVNDPVRNVMSHTFIAVSYTHLDVYKRQIMYYVQKKEIIKESGDE